MDRSVIETAELQGTVQVDRSLIQAQTRNIVTVADSGSTGKALLQGARVVADQRNGSERQETVSDENGHFAFTLPAGDFLITSEFTDEFDLASFAMSTITDGESVQLTLDLSLNGIVYGRVVDGDGLGLNAKVEITELRRYALTVSDGSFTFPSVPVGDYLVWIATSEGGSAVTTISVSPGGRVDAGVLPITMDTSLPKAAGTITVHSTDAEGYPLVGANCTLLEQPAWGISGAQGILTLTVYEYPAELYCGKAGFVQNKLFIADATMAQATLPLSPTTRSGVISLQVVDSALLPLPGVGVDLYTDAGIIKSLLTDSSGAISVNASGCVGVSLYKSGYQSPPPFQICPPNNGIGESYYQIRLCSGADCGDTVDLCSLASKDCAPPTTSLTTYPEAVTTDRSPSFVFAANEAATFNCRMDGGAWEVCTSPKQYINLAGGVNHTFRVYAMDSAGNRESRDVIFSWTLRKIGTLYAIIENSTLDTGFFETLSGEGYWQPPTWQTPDFVDTAANNAGWWTVKQSKLAYDDNYLFVFNFGNVGGVTNDWLYGQSGTSTAGMLEKGWFYVEYNDGSTESTPITCAFMDYAYASFRGQGRLYKEHNGRLRIEPEGHLASYAGVYGSCFSPW